MKRLFKLGISILALLMATMLATGCVVYSQGSKSPDSAKEEKTADDAATQDAAADDTQAAEEPDQAEETEAKPQIPAHAVSKDQMKQKKPLQPGSDQ